MHDRRFVLGFGDYVIEVTGTAPSLATGTAPSLDSTYSHRGVKYDLKDATYVAEFSCCISLRLA